MFSVTNPLRGALVDMPVAAQQMEPVAPPLAVETVQGACEVILAAWVEPASAIADHKCCKILPGHGSHNRSWDILYP